MGSNPSLSAIFFAFSPQNTSEILLNRINLVCQIVWHESIAIWGSSDHLSGWSFFMPEFPDFLRRTMIYVTKWYFIVNSELDGSQTAARRHTRARPQVVQ